MAIWTIKSTTTGLWTGCRGIACAMPWHWGKGGGGDERERKGGGGKRRGRVPASWLPAPPFPPPDTRLDGAWGPGRHPARPHYIVHGAGRHPVRPHYIVHGAVPRPVRPRYIVYGAVRLHSRGGGGGTTKGRHVPGHEHGLLAPHPPPRRLQNGRAP